MGIRSFFNNYFSKPRWDGGPEKFLAFVLFLQKENNPNYSRDEVLQWSEILQKTIKVNLGPYRDFEDLLNRGVPDHSFIDDLKNSVEATKKRIELKKAIYGKDVDLGDDDVMKSNSDSAVRARNTIIRMSKYIQFQEDQDNEKP